MYRAYENDETRQLAGPAIGGGTGHSAEAQSGKPLAYDRETYKLRNEEERLSTASRDSVAWQRVATNSTSRAECSHA